MAKKPKFRPVITRVKLNPEQAVLSCDCYELGRTNQSPVFPPMPYTCSHDSYGQKSPSMATIAYSPDVASS